MDIVVNCETGENNDERDGLAESLFERLADAIEDGKKVQFIVVESISSTGQIQLFTSHKVDIIEEVHHQLFSMKYIPQYQSVESNYKGFTVEAIQGHYITLQVTFENPLLVSKKDSFIFKVKEDHKRILADEESDE